MIKEYFQLSTILVFITDCIKNQEQLFEVFKLLDFMNGGFVNPLDYKKVAKLFRLSILEEYPILDVVNRAKDWGLLLKDEEQERILKEVRETLKDQLINDRLLITRLSK
jgi:hypothetical protein